MRKHLSEEHKRRLSESLKGRKAPWCSGVPLSSEHRAKISATLRGRRLSAETRRKMSMAHMGKHPDEETRKKLSAWQLGRKRPDSFRKKISIIAQGRHWPQAYRDRMRAVKKGTFTGNKASNWNGGRVIDASGYVRVYIPQHPSHNGRGYVPEHRLVIEKVLGRPLRKAEECHHLNKKKSDNRLSNLMVFKSKGDHLRFEAGKSVPDEAIVFDGRQYH